MNLKLNNIIFKNIIKTKIFFIESNKKTIFLNLKKKI